MAFVTPVFAHQICILEENMLKEKFSFDQFSCKASRMSSEDLEYSA